jgi:hypothetical protein
MMYIHRPAFHANAVYFKHEHACMFCCFSLKTNQCACAMCTYVWSCCNSHTLQAALESVEVHLLEHPEAHTSVNTSALSKAALLLDELTTLATKLNKCQMLSQVALSRKMQALTTDTTVYYTDAVSKLQLAGTTATDLSVKLLVDENVSVLIGAMDQVEVKLSVIGSAVNRMEQRLATAAAAARRVAPLRQSTNIAIASNRLMLESTLLNAEEQVIAAALHDTVDDSIESLDDIHSVSTTNTAATQQSLSINAMSLSIAATGNGPVLDSRAYRKFESTLQQLQVSPDAVVKLQDTPIGRGGFAKVYKVQFNNTVCAAKVSVTYILVLLIRYTYCSFHA